MVPDVLVVLEQFTQTLDRLGIPYLVGGSVASSTLGAYRYTNDIDIVVDLQDDSILDLAGALAGEYYVDVDTINEAVRLSSSFSCLNLATMMKVDVFIKTVGAWSDSAWSRRKIQKLDTSGYSFAISIRTPEDMILQKLNWYKMGREVSDRQWSDVIGMLEVQVAGLDFAYLEKWAQNLSLAKLLSRAYGDAGIQRTR